MNWLETTVTIIVSIIASSGFWTFILAKSNGNKTQDLIIRGIAHTEVINEGKKYLERGWITHEEFDDFMTYLGTPYINLGANGLAKKVISAVQELPIKSVSELSVDNEMKKVIRNEQSDFDSKSKYSSEF